MTEKRAFSRWPILVEVTLDSRHTFFRNQDGPSYAWDISEGGIFVSALRPPPVGTLLRFHLTLPDCEDPIQASGEVRWITMEGGPLILDSASGPGNKRPSGMGLKFLELTDEDAARIKGFVAEQRRAASVVPPAKETE